MSGFRTIVIPVVSVSAILACATGLEEKGAAPGSQTGSGGSSGSTGASGASGSSGTAGAGGTVLFGPDGGVIVGSGDTCAATIEEGKPSPLDMYIMLDSSGSMTAEVTGGITKAEAVATAIADFVNADASRGIGVGLQFFPLAVPGTPETCTTNDECGAAGPCQLSICSADVDVVFCVDASDCSDPQSECVPVGACERNPTYLCPAGGRCPLGLGACVDFTRQCVNGTVCDPAPYAEPAVPITPLPEGAVPIIDAMINRTWIGLTPTGPALRGALDHTKTWAEAHPDHTVVTVLATDGLPTECSPTDINQIALIAAAGVGGLPSIRTFVIGVSSLGDLDSPDNLAAIADSGGTGTPLFVDATLDVTAQFVAALDTIRKTVLSCELQIPAPADGQELDYKKVNLHFTEGSTTRELAYVSSADLCSATDNGWYYDHDPSTGEQPTKIVVCPTVCNDFKASVDGVVNLEIGCATREAIIR